MVDFCLAIAVHCPEITGILLKNTTAGAQGRTRTGKLFTASDFKSDEFTKFLHLGNIYFLLQYFLQQVNIADYSMYEVQKHTFPVME